MIALWLIACLALASAAPQFESFGHYEHRPFRRTPPSDSVEDFFNGDVFDTRRFWAEMAVEMQKLDEMLNQLTAHFPVTSSERGIVGNEYVITINLDGFEENDIKVKAREGVVLVQAVHKTDDGSQRSYLDIKSLPSYVNVNGTWTYNMGVLKVVFPLNSRPEVATEASITQDPENDEKIDVRDREEVEVTHHENTHHDADVGIEEGERDIDNEIPNSRVDPVEATTYAVDLKNEVELVDVRKDDFNNYALGRRW